MTELIMGCETDGTNNENNKNNKLNGMKRKKSKSNSYFDIGEEVFPGVTLRSASIEKCCRHLLPKRGTASEVAGIVSATMFRNTVSDSSIVTPKDTQL